MRQYPRQEERAAEKLRRTGPSQPNCLAQRRLRPHCPLVGSKAFEHRDGPNLVTIVTFQRISQSNVGAF